MGNVSEGPWAQPLAALREAGAAQCAPLRWHHLNALARRTQSAPADVQAVLAPRLNALLGHWLDDLQAEGAPLPELQATPKATPAVARQPGALAALTHHLQAVRQAQHQASHPVGSGLLPDTGHPGESPSVSRFRETWAHIAAEHQVARAVARAPDNAGPLNSHMLVLRSLSLMQEVSPDYLRRFLSHVDTLLWLEQATEVPKTPRRSRSKK